MSMLGKRFPTAVMINGEPVDINTDYRIVLKISSAFNDAELLEAEKLEVLIKLLYPTPPSDIASAIKQGLKFINLGEEIEPSKETKVYDYNKDAQYIYTAFKSSFNIDLIAIKSMHWWEFKMLFADLGECFFSNLVGIRSRLRKGKLMEHERDFVAKNKKIIELDYNDSMDTDTADFIKGIGKPREE